MYETQKTRCPNAEKKTENATETECSEKRWDDWKCLETKTKERMENYANSVLIKKRYSNTVTVRIWFRHAFKATTFVLESTVQF